MHVQSAHVSLATTNYSVRTNCYVLLFPNFRHNLQKIKGLNQKSKMTVIEVLPFSTTLPKIAKFQLHLEAEFGENFWSFFCILKVPLSIIILITTILKPVFSSQYEAGCFLLQNYSCTIRILCAHFFTPFTDCPHAF